jgi:hypothetical protein
MIEWIWLTALVTDPASLGQASPRPVETLKIDILVKQPEQKCAAQSSDEIVVCAEKTDNESQRLRSITNADIYEKDESKAEFGISENVRMAAEVDSEELGGGVTSKRIMARVKIKF